MHNCTAIDQIGPGVGLEECRPRSAVRRPDPIQRTADGRATAPEHVKIVGDTDSFVADRNLDRLEFTARFE